MDAPDDQWRLIGAFDGLLEFLDLACAVGALGIDTDEAERPLDGHLPGAKGGVGEDLGLIGLLEG